MKQPKRLTRDQKSIVASYGVDPDDWMLLCEDDFAVTIIHKRDNVKRTLGKQRKEKGYDRHGWR